MISLSRIDQAVQRRSFSYFKWRANRDFRAKIDPRMRFLLIYQMGKVGSSSVSQHLKNVLDEWEVFQIHALTEAGVRRIEERYRRASTIRTKLLIDRHILESRYLQPLLGDPGRGPLKTVSIVRDPVARNISAFFQTFEVDFAQMYHESGENASLLNFDVDELVNAFLYGSKQFRHEYPLVWFEEELKEALGIDVYDVPFDHEKGSGSYANAGCDLLVVRMEDFSTALTPLLEAFLDTQIDDVPRSNTASKKHYSEAYRTFIESIRLPAEYLDEMYGSRFVSHFYTDKEIDEFRNRWSR